MKRKWKDNRGETLVEVMASILIGALSVALLFSAVTASFSMDRKAKDADNDFSDSLIAAEAQTGVPVSKKVQVAVKASGVAISPETDVDVNFYGGEGAWSYVLTPP